MSAVQPPPAAPRSGSPREVTLPPALTVQQLAELLSTSPIEIIKELMRSGVMATINQAVDFSVASKAATALGWEVKKAKAEAHTATRTRPKADKEGLARPPVVTILGHVDHGKTTLLDAIRQTNVTASEAGGITQHIGAYQVELKGQKITFLDTPGHQAFTAMRARGAKATDVAVLVVAADDGVMPQTVEALDHARAAGVPIVVALNKIDKPDANPDRVKQQLADHGLVIEEWGGDVICIPVSAKKKEGLDLLLENILLVAEMEELKANPHRPAEGVVIEAKLDANRGPVATLLVENGTLKVGDTMVVGGTWGKVKAMFNDQGKHLRQAGPALPAEVLGLNEVPPAGEVFTVVANERAARNVLGKRQRQAAVMTAAPMASLTDISSQIKAGQVRELNIVLKTDVQGSIDPIRSSLEKLSTDEVKVRILHAASGSITESDVMLAVASHGIIIGFNSRPEPGARRLAEGEGVDIRDYDVIYELVDDVSKALAGMLEPKEREVVEGHAEVRAVFSVGKTSKVAGVYVQDGSIRRGARIRVRRGSKVIADEAVASLKHFKEDVREMATGFECGVGLEGFNAYEVGDILEAYRKEKR